MWLKQVAELHYPQWRESRRRVYTPNGVSPTLHGVGCGGNVEPKIIARRTLSEQVETSGRAADTQLA